MKKYNQSVYFFIILGVIIVIGCNQNPQNAKQFVSEQLDSINIKLPENLEGYKKKDSTYIYWQKCNSLIQSCLHEANTFNSKLSFQDKIFIGDAMVEDLKHTPKNYVDRKAIEAFDYFINQMDTVQHLGDYYLSNTYSTTMGAISGIGQKNEDRIEQEIDKDSVMHSKYDPYFKKEVGTGFSGTYKSFFEMKKVVGRVNERFNTTQNYLESKYNFKLDSINLNWAELENTGLGMDIPLSINKK
jgi:hypothetical protein